MMTNLTIKVRADQGSIGTNKIEVFLDTALDRSLKVTADQGGQLEEDVALYYAVERIAQLEAENRKLRMYYAGAAGLLSQLSDLAHEAGEGSFEMVERAISDWCGITGWRYEINFDKVQLISPEGEEYA